MRTLIFMLAGALAPAVQAAPQEPVWSLAQKEKPAVIETLRELVNIESGSRDKEGLDRLAAHLGERLAALGAKRGPVLFQLPPNLKKDMARLTIFLAQLPADRRVALEVRHESWYDDEVYEALGGRDVALCAADTDEAQMPFGGVKASGIGPHEQGREAIDFFTKVKSVYINYA